MAGTGERFPRDDDVARIIRIKARILARRLRADEEDRRDFEQGLWLRYLRVRERYDPSRGQMSTFLDRVFTNEILNMSEKWYTQKRSAERRARDLNEAGNDENSLSLEETYSQEDYFAETSCGPRPVSETRDTRTDVFWALRRLPHDLRGIAERLMLGSVSDVARQLSIPRATLYGKIRRIEEAFQVAGLDPRQPGGISKKVGRILDSSRGSSGK